MKSAKEIMEEMVEEGEQTIDKLKRALQDWKCMMKYDEMEQD